MQLPRMQLLSGGGERPELDVFPDYRMTRMNAGPIYGHRRRLPWGQAPWLRVLLPGLLLVLTAAGSEQRIAGAVQGKDAEGRSVAAPAVADHGAAANPTATLTTNVNEVSLDLVVRDKKHRLVLDLTPKDLAVTDDGFPVTLSKLRLAAGAGAPRVVTLVFDRFEDTRSKSARAIAGKILKAMPGQGFSIAVLLTDGRLRLVQQYTADRALAEKAVAVATEAAGTDLGSESAAAEKALTAEAGQGGGPAGSVVEVSAAAREEARTTLGMLTSSQQMVTIQHTPPALAGLMSIAEAERQIPGRKAVLYFTGGLQADTRGAEMIETAAGEANRAGVSLYVVDMSALTMDPNQDLMVSLAMGRRWGMLI